MPNRKKKQSSGEGGPAVSSVRLPLAHRIAVALMRQQRGSIPKARIWADAIEQAAIAAGVWEMAKTKAERDVTRNNA